MRILGRREGKGSAPILISFQFEKLKLIILILVKFFWLQNMHNDFIFYIISLLILFVFEFNMQKISRKYTLYACLKSVCLRYLLVISQQNFKLLCNILKN